MIGSSAKTEQKIDPATGKPQEPSIGEKWWHRLTYTGVGYAANLAVSVVLWDFFIKGGGKPVYHGIEAGSKSALAAAGMDAKAAQSTAEGVAKYIFSPLGGHITMVPVKFLEDHAGKITHELNKMLDPHYKYKDLEVSWSDPDEKAPALVSPPNKNTWTQIALRRTMGWGAVIASGVALRSSGFEGPLERGTLRLFDKAVDATGSKSLKDFSQGATARSYAELTALDLYMTVVTSAITALTKNTFGEARNNSAPDDALSIDVPGVTEQVAATPGAPGTRVSVASAEPHHGHARHDNKLKPHENYQELAVRDPQTGHTLQQAL